MLIYYAFIVLLLIYYAFIVLLLIYYVLLFCCYLLCVHCSVVNLLCVHCSVVNFEHVIAHGGYPVKMSDIYAILCVTRNCDIVTGVFC